MRLVRSGKISERDVDKQKGRGRERLPIDFIVKIKEILSYGRAQHFANTDFLRTPFGTESDHAKQTQTGNYQCQ